MIFIRPDLEESDLVPRFNLDTRRFQLSFDFSSEHCFAVLGWTDKVIQQHADIMAFVQVFAHTTSVERLRCIEASLGESDPKRLMLQALPKRSLDEVAAQLPGFEAKVPYSSFEELLELEKQSARERRAASRTDH